MQTSKNVKQGLIVGIVLSLLVSPFSFAKSGYAASDIRLVSSEVITAGAELLNYSLIGVTGQNVKVNVVKVDLDNPYIEVDTMTGDNGKLSGPDRTTNMANEERAVAAINGDFFNMSNPTSPLGPQVKDGELISSPSFLVGMNSFGVDKNNKPFIAPFKFEGSVTSADGQSFILAGINKGIYYPDVAGVVPHSHSNQLHMYTDKWGMLNRGIGDGLVTPTEVLVKDDIVQEISVGKPFSKIVPQGSYIMTGHGTAAKYLEHNVNVGDKLYVDYEISPAKDWQAVVGGHTILVENGQRVPYSRDVSKIGGNRARTAIGYSQDEKYMYLVSAEKSGSSAGMQINEVTNFLIYLGAWKGVLMDGGGSTAMSARHLGDFQASQVTVPEEGSERRVINGLVIRSTAPKGNVTGIVVTAPSIFLVGEKTNVGLKAYDIHHNPVNPSELTFTGTMTGEMGTYDGASRQFTAAKPGSGKLTITAGPASKTVDIQVAGAGDIASLTPLNSQIKFQPGEAKKVDVSLTLMNGKQRTIPSHLLQWKVVGDIGTVASDGTLTAGQNTASGLLIASYDGYTSGIAIQVGTTSNPLYVMEEATNQTFVGSSTDVKGSFQALTDANIAVAGKKYLQYSYDFTNAGNEVWAYGQYGVNAEGIELPGSPTGIKMQINGDGSKNRFRAELIDANGKTHYTDLAMSIDWTGWKSVTAPFPSGMAYPVKLKRVYVYFDPSKDDAAGKARTGQLLLDDISLISFDSAATAKPVIELTIGKKEIIVNGQKQTIDVAPLIVNSRTLVPISFIASALGGKADWIPARSQIDAYTNDSIVTMWNNNKSLILNGKRVLNDVAPQIIHNRTMVPVSILSSGFGLEAKWNAETRTVTIQEKQ